MVHVDALGFGSLIYPLTPLWSYEEGKSTTRANDKHAEDIAYLGLKEKP